MWLRLRHVFGDAPVLFFAVVTGVAFTFRVGVGLARDASMPPVVAQTFTSAPAIASGIVAPERPAASPVPPGTTAVVGAAAKVQPLGTPSPARVAPKPRGHGPRPANH